MGLLNKFKNAAAATGLVEFGNSESTPTPVTTQPQVFVTPAIVPAVATGGQMGVGPDAEIVKTLNETISCSKVPGYEQFRVIVDTLQGIPDSQKYPMALKLVEATHKMDARAIVTSIDDRLQIIAAEQANFEAAFEQEMQQTVVAAQSEIERIAEEIEAKKEAIRDLEARRITLTQQAGDSSVNLEKERATFNASVEVVRSALSGERDRILVTIPQPQAK